MHFQRNKKRAFKLLSYLVIFSIVILSLSTGVFGLTATPSSDNFQKSQVKWYQAKDFLTPSGSIQNSASIYYGKSTSQWAQSLSVGASFYDSANFYEHFTSSEFENLATAGWWSVPSLEYYSWVYEGVSVSYNPNNACIVFWFAENIPILKDEQIELWLKISTNGSRTQYEDQYYSESSILEPFLYTVTDLNFQNTTASMSTKLNLYAGFSDDWGLYHSDNLPQDSYILGIGWRISDEYASTISPPSWIDVRINISSAFVGKINQYFLGEYNPYEDEYEIFTPEIELPDDLNDAFNSAFDALTGIDELFANVFQTSQVLYAVNFFQDLLNQIFAVEFILLFSISAGGILVVKILFGR